MTKIDIGDIPKDPGPLGTAAAKRKAAEALARFTEITDNFVYRLAEDENAVTEEEIDAMSEEEGEALVEARAQIQLGTWD
jgi:hypothetical protein